MGFELLLLCALIFIFIVSFCGLLQKIKQSYDRERMIADRLARRQTERNSEDSFSDVYVNSAFQSERNNESGIFPAAPPPYSQNYADAPPKYEDVIKTEDIDVPATVEVTSETTNSTNLPRVHSSPPPYTIST
ncbi:uncharacterized protein LOC108911485 isoform X1 [Anoplophora glabripennis]|uniref:uncharacterized protein LOC108911485 isoform X1 n=1 Tax=Anoplophora glabripennis TaxID=217634 RepID=UPI000874836D|nr:uncharacterized protein LOC108911485 isoform X1 [Anoplophora glabripennis]